MRLTWKPYRDAIWGNAFRLEGLPEGSCAYARRMGISRAFVANAFISGSYMQHRAGSVAAAVRRLNKEINRRSIGLFGVDDITIETDTD